MPAPTPSWDLVDLHATWLENGALKTGTYEISIPVRLTSAVDDSIIPAARYASGSLNVTNGVPSLVIPVPATNDPDILSFASWLLHIVVKFENGAPETYDISVSYAARPVLSGGTGAGVNLRLFAPNEGAAALAVSSISFTGPNSVATRNSLGQVTDGSGAAIGGVSAYADLTGKPTLGTASSQSTTAFATSAQGGLADTAVQPSALATAISGFAPIASPALTGIPTINGATAATAPAEAGTWNAATIYTAGQAVTYGPGRYLTPLGAPANAAFDLTRWVFLGALSNTI